MASKNGPPNDCNDGSLKVPNKFPRRFPRRFPKGSQEGS